MGVEVEGIFMKLLIVTQTVDKNDPILGFFHRWIEEFSKHFEKITVICLQKGSYELPNVEVFSLGKEEGAGTWERVKRFRRYTKEHSKDYDAVFVHMNPEYILLRGWFWKRNNKKTFLWYTHKNVDLKLKIAEKLVDTIFTASKESFRLPSKKVLVTEHGIDTDFFVPGNKERIIPLITTGRIDPVKNLEVAIRAVSSQENSNKTPLVIVGKGSNEYMKGLMELDPLGRVSFKRPVSHRVLVNDYLQQAQVFVHASETGSLDKAVLEAMSCGVIPITSSEAFTGLLNDHKDLLLFKKGDEVQLAHNINMVLNLSDQKKDALTKQLREKVVKLHSLSALIPRLTKKIQS